MHGCADGAGARERVEMRGEKGARIRMEMGGEKGHVAVGMSEGGCADVHGRCGGKGTDGNGCHGEGAQCGCKRMGGNGSGEEAGWEFEACKSCSVERFSV